MGIGITMSLSQKKTHDTAILNSKEPKKKLIRKKKTTIDIVDNTKATINSSISTIPDDSFNGTVESALPPFIQNGGITSYIEEPHTIIQAYFDGRHLDRLVEHQISSYNDFVNFQVHRTIAMFNPVHICSPHDLDKELNKYNLEMFITVDNLTIQRAQIHEINGSTKNMYPHEARNRNFTYAGDMNVDLNIKFVVRTGTMLESIHTFNNKLKNINIGKMPIMTGSSICILSNKGELGTFSDGECRLDSGGYFIVNGSEKVVIGQERASENTIQCYNISKTSTKWSWIAEIKSIPDSKCISPKQLSMTIGSKTTGIGGGLWIQIPRLKNPLPLFVVFRVLGIISDKEICEFIMLNIDDNNNKIIVECVTQSVKESNEITDYEMALKYVISNVMFTVHPSISKDAGAEMKRKFALDVINSDLFPHCNTTLQKIYFMGHMARYLITCSAGLDIHGDRDSFNNKRVDLTGSLMNNLFRNYYNKMIKDLQKQSEREINNGSWKTTQNYMAILNMTNIYKLIKSTTIENGLKRALATGDFGVKQCNSTKVGVAQVLNRLTYISALSHLRRVNTPIDKNGKLIPPRKLHPTSFGFICPAETPEGGSVGVVKNLSYMTQMTIHSNSTAIHDYVADFITPLDSNILPIQAYNKFRLFINGTWIGITDRPIELYHDLKTKKYKGIINIFASIILDVKRKDIRVCTEAGRMVRPLLRVVDNKLLITADIINRLSLKELTWDDLFTDCKLDSSVMEYIDSNEQSCSMIAMTPEKLNTPNDSNIRYTYTHCEIHPSTIFGILASCIPFPEHNQSPRNTYQCAMGKQAMGIYGTNFDTRMDKTAYVLTTPMRPLVDTRLMNMIELNKLPSGCQVIVAIMSHTGYNQEDSILFNKGSIDRGLFQATIYHTEKDEDKKIHGDEEIRCNPDPSKTKGMKFGNYSKINSQGVVNENTLIANRDIIIAKIIPIKEARNDPTKIIKYTDQSRILRTNEETFVDKNYIERNGDGYSFCKTRLRILRPPIIGDKFSSRHGQKGTIGNIIPECDMPFLSNGLKPDIIINPHAIPSRMTIAQLKETVLGKTVLELGLFGDGTSFGTFDIKDICKELQKVGYESNGNDILYNGLTGDQFETSVFIGPVFYQRLKHMVSDKQHSRSTGPMVNMTRQPAEGRSNDGGLRFGEMERDCMCSHGASRFTKERVYDVSDAFQVNVCKKCGMIASYNDNMDIHFCRTCENRSDFDYVELPYSCKLLFQELITMNVAPRIITK